VEGGHSVLRKGRRNQRTKHHIPAIHLTFNQEMFANAEELRLYMRGRGKESGREKVNASTSEADPQSKDSTPEFEFESAGVLERRCGSKVGRECMQ